MKVIITRTRVKTHFKQTLYCITLNVRIVYSASASVGMRRIPHEWKFVTRTSEASVADTASAILN